MVANIWQDMRFGIRQMMNRPGVPVLVMLLLALGIGVNTAWFSVVKAVVLDPLPFDSPERLTMVWETDLRTSRCPVSGPNFLDWREQNHSFERLVAFAPYSANLTGEGNPERIEGIRTASGMFELLYVQPELGRSFSLEDEQPGNTRVAIISYGLWSRRFSADRSVLGKSIKLDGEPHTLIGIMPRGFRHLCPWTLGRQIDAWTPISRNELDNRRDGHWLLVFGRLKDGTTLEAAEEEMKVIAKRVGKAYPEANQNRGARVSLLHKELVGRVGGQLILLLGATGLVLLISCGNVAGLMLSRASTRQTEVAIRTSLGASRARLRRQFLAENVPLFLISGGLSLLLAGWGIHTLRAIIPSNIPRAQEIGIDGWVLAFTLGISLATGLLFGLVPAFLASRTDLSKSLKQGRGHLQVGGNRIRDVLVVTQFAMTLILANGCALMLQSYIQLVDREHGFSTRGVVTMKLDLRGPQYEQVEQVHAFYRKILEGIEGLPGVKHAGAVSRLPLEGGTNSTAIIEGHENDFGEEKGPLVELKVTTPDYFDAIGIPLIAGRKLTEQDGSPGRPGVIINHAMARRIWPNENPLGKRFSVDPPNWLTVVGVAGDTRQWGLEQEPIAEAYFPYSPEVKSGLFSFKRIRYVVVRTDVDPLSMVPAIRKEIWAVDNEQPVSDIRTTGTLLSQSAARRRFNTILLVCLP